MNKNRLADNLDYASKELNSFRFRVYGIIWCSSYKDLAINYEGIEEKLEPSSWKSESDYLDGNLLYLLNHRWIDAETNRDGVWYSVNTNKREI